jgi:hypothetical protein
MGNQKENHKFALCVENKDCEDLEKRKIYQILPDEESEKEGYLRVVDESGEDYLIYLNRPTCQCSGCGKPPR